MLSAARASVSPLVVMRMSFDVIAHFQFDFNNNKDLFSIYSFACPINLQPTAEELNICFTKYFPTFHYRNGHFLRQWNSDCTRCFPVTKSSAIYVQTIILYVHFYFLKVKTFIFIFHFFLLIKK